MIKGSIQEDYITFIDNYVPNIGAPKYVRQKLTGIKRKNASENQLHYFYILMIYQKEKLRNNPTYNCIKKNKIPRNAVNEANERPVLCEDDTNK